MNPMPTPEQLLHHLEQHPRYQDQLMSYPSVLAHLATRFAVPAPTIHTWLKQALPSFDQLLVLLCTEGNHITGLATLHGELTAHQPDYATVTPLEHSALNVHGPQFLEVLTAADIDPTGTLTGLDPELHDSEPRLWLATWWTLGQRVGHILHQDSIEHRVATTTIPADLSTLDNLS